MGYPQIIHFSKIFHYKPSSYWGTSTQILGNHHRYTVEWKNKQVFLVFVKASLTATPHDSREASNGFDTHIWNNCAE